MNEIGPSVRRDTLVICTIGAFLVPFMSSSLNVALPAIATDFRTGAITLSWVTAGFMFSAAVFLVPFGRLADIYGRKRIFALGVFVYTVSSALAGLAPSAPALVLLRVAQGLGGAMMFGTNAAILASVFPPGERGRALGINVAAVYIGLSTGPFIGGLLTQTLGWRSVFAANVPLGIGLVWYALKRLPREPVRPGKEYFDIAGALIYGTSMLGIMSGFSTMPSARGIALALAGFAGLAVFYVHERKTSSPIIDFRQLGGNRVFLFSNLAAFANYGATAGSGFLLSLYLQYVKGLSPLAAGSALLAQPVIQALVSPFAGRMSDRIEPRIISSVGMAATSLGLLLLTALGKDSPMVFVLSALCLLGLGFGAFSSPNTNAIMSSVRKDQYGLASATVGTMRLTGTMLSMGVVMMLLAVNVGRKPLVAGLFPAFLLSARSAYLIFSALCFVGIFASLARGKTHALEQKAGAPGPRRFES